MNHGGIRLRQGYGGTRGELNNKTTETPRFVRHPPIGGGGLRRAGANFRRESLCDRDPKLTRGLFTWRALRYGAFAPDLWESRGAAELDI